MFTLGLDYIWYHNQRYQDLLAEVQHYHLVKESLKARQPEFHKSSKILAYLGKKLTSIGKSLKERYGVQPQAELPLNQ